MSVIGTLVLAVVVQAQELQIDQDILTAGGNANVKVKDPSKAGQTVLVEIDNGNPSNLLYDYVLVDLDANGKGSASWHVPEGGWDAANFMAPGIPTESYPVVPGQPPAPPPQGTV